ncbi:hypothetical protein [Sinorhizobium meliloti]|uniref:hypothetical protein n=1 Tax=Rhizobium meliloti TaxID=382 RepID=UPI001F324015|nr:hypothetical protein [Sinorhizobium meliloti]
MASTDFKLSYGSDPHALGGGLETDLARLKFRPKRNEGSWRTGSRGCWGKIIARRSSGKGNPSSSPGLLQFAGTALSGKTVSKSPDATASWIPALSDDE